MERAVQASPLGPAGRAYLEARGLLEVATDPASGVVFGEVSRTPPASLQPYAGRLVVPSFSARGTVTHITFRCMEDHDCGDLSHGKYMHWPGVDSRLYNVAAVQTHESTIHLTEGQLDAATLVACGLPAVGIPGSQAWKPHHHRLFVGFERVCFWADQDDKGSSMGLAERIRRDLPFMEVMMVGSGLDVNSHYLKHGRDSITALCCSSSEKGESDEEDPHEGWDEDYPPPPF
jgi:hypothetical protein